MSASGQQPGRVSSAQRRLGVCELPSRVWPRMEELCQKQTSWQDALLLGLLAGRFADMRHR